MLQFVLEFLQAIVSESDEEFEAVVGGFGVANFVGLHRREVVLLLELRAQIAAGAKAMPQVTTAVRMQFWMFMSDFS